MPAPLMKKTREKKTEKKKTKFLGNAWKGPKGIPGKGIGKNTVKIP